MRNLILAASIAVFLNACGGGSSPKANTTDESTSTTDNTTIQSSTTPYTDSPTPIDWIGSVNNELVSDANGDFVWFDTSGNMYAGNVLILNFWIDGYNVYLNSDYIGDVADVQTVSGGKMTMIVAPSPNNYALDFYVQDGIFYVQSSTFVPIFLEHPSQPEFGVY
jgi:hypothetical protein